MKIAIVSFFENGGVGTNTWQPPTHRPMKWLSPDSKSLIFLLTLGDAKLGHFALGSLHEILDLRLDDASDTLPKM